MKMVSVVDGWLQVKSFLTLNMKTGLGSKTLLQTVLIRAEQFVKWCFPSFLSYRKIWIIYATNFVKFSNYLPVKHRS